MSYFVHARLVVWNSSKLPQKMNFSVGFFGIFKNHIFTCGMHTCHVDLIVSSHDTESWIFRKIFGIFLFMAIATQTIVHRKYFHSFSPPSALLFCKLLSNCLARFIHLFLCVSTCHQRCYIQCRKLCEKLFCYIAIVPPFSCFLLLGKEITLCRNATCLQSWNNTAVWNFSFSPKSLAQQHERNERLFCTDFWVLTF